MFIINYGPVGEIFPALVEAIVTHAEPVHIAVHDSPALFNVTVVKVPTEVVTVIVVAPVASVQTNVFT